MMRQRHGAMLCAIGLGLALACGAGEARTTEELKQAVRMYKVAEGPFKPMYPLLAKQIVDDFGITKGICVDVGAGTGHLARELAKITQLKIYCVDIDPMSTRLNGDLTDEAGLTGRVLPLEGDVHDMPLRDNFADLVISRGSVPFWTDRVQAFKECYRILKPGGVAFIGGGFSRYQPKEQWEKHLIMRKPKDQWPKGWRPIDNMKEDAIKAGIPEPEQREEAGTWLIFRKPAQ